jgi:Fe2+ or Zn2+ uptake regulation protein
MIGSLPKNQLWRHNVAGDLEHINGDIDVSKLEAITQANRGKKGFAYTHHELNQHNISAIKYANNNGFTVNASANNYNQADHYFNQGLPTVCVLPTNATDKSYQTEQGNTIVTCPAALHDHINCSTCGICANSERDFIVGFPAHGAGKKKANLIALENI